MNWGQISNLATHSPTYTLQGYFDTLRMELADTGVGILTVCPGPVDTPFMRELFGKELVQKRKVCGSVIILFVIVRMHEVN